MDQNKFIMPSEALSLEKTRFD
jgi:hypothetical protein